MDVVDHSNNEEEQSRSQCVTSSGRSGSRFGARRLKRRPGTGGHQQLLLTDCIGGNGADRDGASEETVPLSDYEWLSQSARLPDEDPSPKNVPPPLREQQQQPTHVKKAAAGDHM